MKKKTQKKTLELLADVYATNETTNTRIIALLEEMSETEKYGGKTKKDASGKSKKDAMDEFAEMVRKHKAEMEAEAKKRIEGAIEGEPETADGSESELADRDMKIEPETLKPRYAGDKVMMTGSLGTGMTGSGGGEGLPPLASLGHAPDRGAGSAPTADKIYCGVCRRYHTRGTHD